VHKEDGVLSFLRHHDWEILAMDARLELQLELPSDDGGQGQQPVVMNLNLMSSTAAADDDDNCKISGTGGGEEIS
uniref:Uncharacterized protein n=1 Tax=Aegilops tauschii subsp. strangulata TaxID=200361 RepID=A0A453GYN1_AEGTS